MDQHQILKRPLRIKETEMYRPVLITSMESARFKIVKAILLASLLGFTSATASAEDWTTTDGTSYQNVRVVRVEDDAVTILYKDGGALVFLNKLPPSLQERFDYDPVKAKAAAEARTKADAENAIALQKEIELSNQLKRQQQIKDAAALTTTPPSK
jgi:hypothetical protein